MSRRKFLHLIAGLLASSSVTPLSAAPAKHIVVVGAGISQRYFASNSHSVE